ncbi:hypothetical protein COSO111634_38505 [Corallococcus soli]
MPTIIPKVSRSSRAARPWTNVPRHVSRCPVSRDTKSPVSAANSRGTVLSACCATRATARVCSASRQRVWRTARVSSKGVPTARKSPPASRPSSNSCH